MFANVMIPAFAAPYFVLFFLPWAIFVMIASEYAVWRCFNRVVTAGAVLKWVLLGNLVSTLVGALISHRFLVPFGWEEGPNGIAVPSPEYGWMVYAAMIQACLLSMVIEYLALVGFRRRWNIRHLEVCTVLGNLASYAGLTVSMLAYPQVRRFFSEAF